MRALAGEPGKHAPVRPTGPWLLATASSLVTPCTCSGPRPLGGWPSTAPQPSRRPVPSCPPLVLLFLPPPAPSRQGPDLGALPLCCCQGSREAGPSYAGGKARPVKVSEMNRRRPHAAGLGRVSALVLGLRMAKPREVQGQTHYSLVRASSRPLSPRPGYPPSSLVTHSWVPSGRTVCPPPPPPTHPPLQRPLNKLAPRRPGRTDTMTTGNHSGGTAALLPCAPLPVALWAPLPSDSGHPWATTSLCGRKPLGGHPQGNGLPGGLHGLCLPRRAILVPFSTIAYSLRHSNTVGWRR